MGNQWDGGPMMCTPHQGQVMRTAFPSRSRSVQYGFLQKSFENGDAYHHELPSNLACRRFSNDIFILGFDGLGKDNCTARRQAFKFGDSVRLLFEVWPLFFNSPFFHTLYAFHKTRSDWFAIVAGVWYHPPVAELFGGWVMAEWLTCWPPLCVTKDVSGIQR